MPVVRRRELHDGFVLEHDRGRLEVHELAPGVIFQDYYGLVVDEYYEPVVELAEHRLSEGRRLSFFSDISRVNSSSANYRRWWATWFENEAAKIDDIVVFMATTLGRMAVRAANLITGGSIRTAADPEVFQVEIERVVVAAWEQEPDTSAEVSLGSVSPRDPPTPPSGQANEVSAEADTCEDGERAPVLQPRVRRNIALDLVKASVLGPGDDEIATGARIGRFRVDGKLGEGGMGVVYACHDEELGRDVAVKLLHGQRDDVSHERLVREARAMAKLTHPRIVRIYEIGEHDGHAFLVMELVEGSTVRQWLEGGPRSRDDIMRVFVEAGEGLAAAHERGLVHRDFKPDNVMLGDDGRVLVMDFGLARVSDAVLLNPLSSRDTWEPTTALTATGVIVGTPAYMSPEQFLAAPTDAKTDQYSFCVALWEAVYGQRPFTGSNVFALSRAVLGTAPQPKSGGDVPRWLRRVLTKGLAADPDDRWPSLDALLDALRGGGGWLSIVSRTFGLR